MKVCNNTHLREAFGWNGRSIAEIRAFLRLGTPPREQDATLATGILDATTFVFSLHPDGHEVLRAEIGSILVRLDETTVHIVPQDMFDRNYTILA